MALFGGGGAQQGLAVTVSAFGTEETTGKLHRVAGAAAKVDKSAGAATGGTSRLSGGLARVRSMAWSVVGTLGKLSGVLGIGGVFAFAGLVRETLDVERGLHRIAFQSGRSAAEMQRMRDVMNAISGATGVTRAAVLSAISAAEDFGIPLEEAAKHMEALVLWSDLLGVSTDQASGAVGAIKRAIGDVADLPQIMSMLNAAALNAGFDEGLMMQLVTKLAPQLQGIAGIADITSFFQAIAGMGEELAGDPRQITSSFKLLNKGLSDKKTVDGWRKFGIQGDNAAEVLLSIAQKLMEDESSLDNAKLPDEIMTIARVMADNGDKINGMGTAVDLAAGNVTDFSNQVMAHKNDPEIAWGATMEKLKTAMAPFINDVMNWFIANGPTIVEIFQGVIDAVGAFGSALTTAGESAGQWLAKFLGIDTETQVKEAEAAGRAEADRLSKAGFYAARTPEERAAALARAGPGVGEGVGSETWFDRVAALTLTPAVPPTQTAFETAARSAVGNLLGGWGNSQPGAQPIAPSSPITPPTRVETAISIRTVEGIAVDADSRVVGRSDAAVTTAVQ